jgi:hypothetical protein
VNSARHQRDFRDLATERFATLNRPLKSLDRTFEELSVGIFTHLSNHKTGEQAIEKSTLRFDAFVPKDKQMTIQLNEQIEEQKGLSLKADRSGNICFRERT